VAVSASSNLCAQPPVGPKMADVTQHPAACKLCGQDLFNFRVGRNFSLYRCAHCNEVYCGLCLEHHFIRVRVRAARRLLLEYLLGRRFPLTVIDTIAKFDSAEP